jgi:hypothetical protein
VPTISTWEYVLTFNGLLAIQEGSAKTFGHRDEIIIGHFRSVQVDNTIVEINIWPLHNARFIDPEATIDHKNKNISWCLTGFLVVGVFDWWRIKLFQDSLFFSICQITDGLILYVPFTPFVYRGVISEALCIPADLIELPGPEADCDVLDARVVKKLIRIEISTY